MEIDVKECINGHHFDSRKYKACPRCGAPLKELQPSKEKSSVGKRLNPFSKLKPNTRDSHEESSASRRHTYQDTERTWGRVDETEPTPVVESVPSEPRPAPLQDQAPPYSTRNTGMSCPKCGQPYPGIGAFCTGCGAPISFKDGKTQATMMTSSLLGTEQTSSVPYPQSKGQPDSFIFPEEDKFTPMPEPEVECQPQVQAQPQINTAPAESPFQNAVRTAKEQSEGKTVGFFYGAASPAKEPPRTAEPTVGWLVCIRGEHFGESFSITFGRNSVGRESSNSIIISRDKTVSREKHAWITYEPKRRDFYIQAGESRGLTYLNEDPIMESRQLQSKDRIQFGNGEYIFVPLCGPDFAWEDIK